MSEATNSQTISSENNGLMTHRQIMITLVGLMTGMLLAALDQTIVSTALKKIVEDFNGLDHYTWEIGRAHV